ncbi:hypothetical protein [Pseudoroseomonas cervicalis]|uniref:hypothetical protein n=1 Tax=Teichococcus cervicalis TaxID=204525 RepID=UPI002788BF32|nr:hypothetical protein [Pseudoroseomonas cervicalis]MDQ1080129.1 hypothetical protein [Pseudoroseomonas cervicalis]
MSWTRAVLCAALVYFGLVGGGLVALCLFFGGFMLWHGQNVFMVLMGVLSVAAFPGLGLYLAWQAFVRRSVSALLMGLPFWAAFSIEALALAALRDTPMFWVDEKTTISVTGTVLLVLGAGWLLVLLSGVVLWRLPQEEPGKAEPSRH